MGLIFAWVNVRDFREFAKLNPREIFDNRRFAQINLREIFGNGKFAKINPREIFPKIVFLLCFFPPFIF